MVRVALTVLLCVSLALAVGCGKRRVTTNIHTDMGTGDMLGALQRAGETNTQLAHMGTPMMPPYVSMPEDIAYTVCWLATDESKCITASAISVDNGSSQY